MPITLLVALFFVVGPAPSAENLALAVQEALDRVVSMQEGPNTGEWPYEGVYRVGGKIPYAYRVGGTSIVAESLIRAPGYAESDARKAAVRRATEFVCTSITEPLLQVSTYQGGYDVRAWASCYGARFLLALAQYKVIPVGLESQVATALAWYIDSLQRFEIPVTGGWNYARDAGAETPSATSGFMTPVCLQTLYEAKAQGHAVDAGIVARAITALERCRTEDGNVSYSATKQARIEPKMIPGAIGRMVATETALYLAGRSDTQKIKRAVEDFVQYWGELEKRRAKNGTHLAPYGVAPYYFWFAHYHAAQAIELLPSSERAALRAQLNARLWQTRSSEGTWNDRVFPRSAAYGSAMAAMSVTMPESFAPAMWK
ncbi:MAG: hypothetical protein EXS17_07875 [Phycisphaerales bacterium]|nr:hypothetical protein [Phycisphaerales bacterium]